MISRDEDHFAAEDHALLCTVGTYGVIVEVGPQPQSVLRQDVLEQMHEMTQHILDFIELYNTNALPELPKRVEAFRYLHSIKLPLSANGGTPGHGAQEYSGSRLSANRAGRATVRFV